MVASRRDRLHARDLPGGRDHCRAAERVPHQEVDRPTLVGHEPARLHGVGDLVRERAVTPVALGVTEPDVVEAEHPDALAGQLLADAAGSGAVLAQGEAVGEHAPAADRRLGLVDDARQQGLDVIPSCWYVAQYIGDHPADVDLVPEDQRARYAPTTAMPTAKMSTTRTRARFVITVASAS